MTGLGEVAQARAWVGSKRRSATPGVRQINYCRTPRLLSPRYDHRRNAPPNGPPHLARYRTHAELVSMLPGLGRELQHFTADPGVQSGLEALGRAARCGRQWLLRRGEQRLSAPAGGGRGRGGGGGASDPAWDCIVMADVRGVCCDCARTSRHHSCRSHPDTVQARSERRAAGASRAYTDHRAS